jgi:multiple sugar transport system substrate-binding protein
LAAVVVAATGIAVLPAQAQSFDWRAASGQTINVAIAKQPWSDLITPLIPEFEALSGIKVAVEVLPEDQERQKLSIAFASGGGNVDVFGSQHHNEGARYAAANWYEPLGPLLADKARTAPDFDYGDFLPQSVTDATIRGAVVGIPLYTELEVLMYRKDLLQQAGLQPPETLNALEAAAKTLTRKQSGQYGICLRGKGAAATTVFSGYLHGMGGSWADADNKPMLDTPAAVDAFEYYGRLAREYGPPGGVNLHWLQCQSLMASGRAAMWTDSNIFAATLLDPTKSPHAGQFGFAVFPAGPAGHKPAGGGWYLSIYSDSQHKQAAWLFVQWALDKENVLKAQLAGIPTARASAWQSPQFQASDRAPELTQATLASLQLKDTPSWGPPWVAVNEIRDAIGAAIVVAIQGGDVKAAAAECQKEIIAILQKSEHN